MRKELNTIEGTIAHLLTNNKEELFSLINADQFEKLQTRVNELLDNPSIAKNPAVVEAKLTLRRCAVKKKLYYSTLMTYLTGMKVSIY